MSKAETAIFTNICMIYDGNGNVVVQERKDKAWTGIAFPGGHVEKGESFTDAVIREVFEETGLKVSELKMCGIKDMIRDDGTRYVVHCYKADKFEGVLSSSDEGEVRWAKLSEIPELNLAPYMHGYLRFFLDDTLTEMFYYKEDGEWVEVLK